jgi:(+)-pinoresinol hydroxylase
MKRVAAVLALVAVTSPGLSRAASSIEAGNAVFEKWCLPCHGARVDTGFPGTSNTMYPGTAALAIKYKGAQPALLEERTNLTPELVKFIVRNGLYGMPRTRKTEVSDMELDAIAAYLTRPR